LPRTHTLDITRLGLEHVELHFRKGGLARAGTSLEVRRGIRVVLFDRSGSYGVGEALPLPVAGTEAMHEVVEALMNARQEFEGASDSIEGFLAFLAHRFADKPATRCALDVAMHDLEARLRGVSVAQRLASDARRHIEVNAVIAASDIKASMTQALHAVRRGYRSLKIKLGRETPEDDIARVSAIRSEFGPDIRIRLDPNGAWTLPHALRTLDRLSGLDVEMVEQPVPPQDLDGLAQLHQMSPVPIAADEALASIAGRARLLQGELASIAIVKPMVQGGLASAAHLCREASARGLRVVVTTTFDGPAGTAAALHLSAAHGSPTLAHGLASCEVLDCDFPEILIPHGGRLYIHDLPGLGLSTQPPVTR